MSQLPIINDDAKGTANPVRPASKGQDAPLNGVPEKPMDNSRSKAGAYMTAAKVVNIVVTVALLAFFILVALSIVSSQN